MKQKIIRKYTKEQTRDFAKQVTAEHYGCEVSNIKYVGGGSFGYVYKVKIPVPPYRLILKACRVGGMHLSEAAALKALGDNPVIHIPDVYFIFNAADDVPMDFIAEEYIDGTDCFTDFSKLFCGKNKKKALLKILQIVFIAGIQRLTINSEVLKLRSMIIGLIFISLLLMIY